MRRLAVCLLMASGAMAADDARALKQKYVVLTDSWAREIGIDPAHSSFARPGATLLRHDSTLTSDAMPYTVLLVDDHKILRDGIKAILERTAEFHVVGEAGDGVQAVRICKKIDPDLVLMDIGLPGMNGIEATTEIVRCCRRTNVMILTMYVDENSVVAAFRAGVRAFVVKTISSADLLDALRTVSKGGSYLSPEVSDHLLTRIQHGDLDAKEIPGPLDRLSPREEQVLRLVAEGKTTKDIANLLELGLQTVRTYRKVLMKKINVTNVAGLTQVALAAGLITFGALGQKAKTQAPPGGL